MNRVKHVTVTPNSLILEIDADIRFPDGKEEFVRGAAVFNWDNGVAVRFFSLFLFESYQM